MHGHLIVDSRKAWERFKELKTTCVCKGKQGSQYMVEMGQTIEQWIVHFLLKLVVWLFLSSAPSDPPALKKERKKYIYGPFSCKIHL